MATQAQETETSPLLYVTAVRSAIWRYKWMAMAILTICVLSAGLYTRAQTPIYQASGNIYIENRSRTIIGDSEIGLDFSKDIMRAQRTLALARPVVAPTFERAAQAWKQNPESAAYPNLEAQCEMSVTIDGQLLTLHADHPNPKAAALIVECWAQVFVEEVGKREQAPTKAKGEILTSELPLRRDEWRRKLEAFNEYQQSANVNLDSSGQHPVNVRYADLDKQITVAHQVLESLRSEAQAWAASNGDTNKLVQFHRVRDDQYMMRYSADLADLYRLLAEAHQKYVDGSFEIKKIEQLLKEKDLLRQKGLENISVQLQMELNAQEAKVRVLDDQYAKTKAEYEDLNAKIAQLKKLKQDAEQAQKLYEEIAFQNGSVEVASRSRYSIAQPWGGVETPTAPYKPNLQRNLFTGLMVGLVWVAIAIFLREWLDDSVHTTKQLEAKLGLPVLGTVPLLERRWKGDTSYHLARDHSRTTIVEHLRVLRTALSVGYARHLQAEGRALMVLVTSPLEAEGKSFIAANLATIFAQAGKRTLLIDMDLHKTTLTKQFYCGASPGIGALIAESHPLGVLTVAQPVPNLDFLPSGVRGSAEQMIEGPYLAKALEEARREYEVVIIDTPPVLAVSDACHLTDKCDVTLIVLRSRKTRMTQAERAMDILANAKAKDPVFVLNGVDKLDADVAAYGYAYGYSYGYGYGKTPQARQGA